MSSADLEQLANEQYKWGFTTDVEQDVVEPGLDVLAVATDGPIFDDVADLLTVVRDGGARVVAISDRDDTPADDLILLPEGVPEWLTPIPATVAAQVFSYYVTVEKGIDPDNPRGLHKVTKTV